MLSAPVPWGNAVQPSGERNRLPFVPPGFVGGFLLPLVLVGLRAVGPLERHFVQRVGVSKAILISDGAIEHEPNHICVVRQLKIPKAQHHGSLA